MRLAIQLRPGRLRVLAAAAIALACSGAMTPASAQVDHEQPEQTPPEAGVQYPSLRIVGFGDVNFAAQDSSEGPRGFSEGQLTLHLASALSPRTNVFGEISITPRQDAGTGNPSTTGFNTEVERFIIRFDRSDQLKVSFGRYHTPINWWNTAFHHGQWLQTSIGRPEMVQFGGRFIPVHFVGALAEGTLPAHGWHLGYLAGIGNGRGNVISRAGDAGDNNARPAWLANVFTRPDRLFGLQTGGAVYLDRVNGFDGFEYDERILTGYAVWQREDPEIIAEVAQVHHERVHAPVASSNVAYYVQGAYRLPGVARLWKPYYRYESIDIASNDAVFAGVPGLSASIAGVRYDITTYAAIKSEGRWRRRGADIPRANGWFLQIAFTF